MNTQPPLIGVHTRHAMAVEGSLLAQITGGRTVRVYDLAQPVYDTLTILDPLVSGTESVTTALDRAGGWTELFNDRMAGGETLRLFTAMRQAMLADDPDALAREAREVIASEDLPVVVTGLQSKSDADVIHHAGGTVVSVDYPVSFTAPLNPPLPLQSVDDYLSADTLSAALL